MYVCTVFTEGVFSVRALKEGPGYFNLESELVEMLGLNCDVVDSIIKDISHNNSWPFP